MSPVAPSRVAAHGPAPRPASRRKARAPAKPASDQVDLRRILEGMVEAGASDLHLSPGVAPRYRVYGSLTPTPNRRALEDGAIARLLESVLAPRQREQLAKSGELDFAFSLPALGRFRGNCYREQAGVGLAIRHIPPSIPSLETLGLPESVLTFADRRAGLFLVTGPTGSGKSTTLASIVAHICARRSCHVLTLEDPIEFVHGKGRALVTQREIGPHAKTFADGLRGAMRQDPDVILVGEMRDRDTIGAVLTVAETGHLVLSTLHTTSATDAVSRIVGAFPATRQSLVRGQLAAVLLGVLRQVLIRRSGRSGRVAAAEVLACTAAARAVIRDDRIHQLPSLIQTGGRAGMRTIDDSLAKLCAAGAVSLSDAIPVADDTKELERKIAAFKKGGAS